MHRCYFSQHDISLDRGNISVCPLLPFDQPMMMHPTVVLLNSANVLGDTKVVGREAVVESLWLYLYLMTVKEQDCSLSVHNLANGLLCKAQGIYCHKHPSCGL